MGVAGSRPRLPDVHTWASGHLPREQAEHMIAVDPPVKILIFPLASDGPSVPTAASVSANVRRQTALIARRDVHHCASLHLQTRATTPSGGLLSHFPGNQTSITLRRDWVKPERFSISHAYPKSPSD